MSKAKTQLKKQAHAAKEERQAKRVVTGIAIGLITIMLLCVAASYLLAN